MTAPQWAAPQPWAVPAPRFRPWLLYPVFFVFFVLMGQYAIHPPAAEGSGNGGGLQTGAAVAASNVEEGSPVRRLGAILLAAAAALTWSAARKRRAAAAGRGRHGPAQTAAVPHATTAAPAHSGLLTLLLTAYVGLAAVSWLWADDPPLTARRAVVFLIVAFAAYAVAQAWSLRDLIYFTIFANATSLILGIGGALARGDFAPFAPGYRFVGFANPNLHGIECACLAIATAAALRFGDRRRRGLLLSLLAFALVMIVLTKSRTALVALGAAGLVGLAVSVKRSRLVTVGVAIAALVFAIVVFAPDVVTSVHQMALLGRSAAAEDPSTLSGRTLLWSDLIDWAADRPFLGYGFDSFWTPTHINIESLRRGWVITQAHSGYIETLLDIGWVGLGVLVLILLFGLRAAIKRFHSTHSAVALFGVALLVWYAVNLSAEAIPQSHFNTFVVMAALAHFALRGAAPDDTSVSL